MSITDEFEWNINIRFFKTDRRDRLDVNWEPSGHLRRGLSDSVVFSLEIGSLESFTAGNATSWLSGPSSLFFFSS